MRLVAFVGFLLCFCILPSFAQSQLVLSHASKGEKETYALGTPLRLQCAWQSNKVLGKVTRIEKDYFILTQEVSLDPHDPERITQFHERIATQDVLIIYPEPNLRLRRFQRMYTIGTMGIGGLLIGGTVLDAMMQEKTPNINTVGIATGILFSGLAVRYLGNKKIKLGKKWRLRAQ